MKAKTKQPTEFEPSRFTPQQREALRAKRNARSRKLREQNRLSKNA